MEEVIQIAGSQYLPVKDAADVAELTRDYIARLCRTGKVEARRIGKNWYVLEASLRTFLESEKAARGNRRQKLAEEYARSKAALESTPPIALTEENVAPPPAATIERPSFRNITEKTSLPVTVPLPDGIETTRSFVPGKFGAAALSLCLVFVAWTFLAPAPARVLATNIFSNADDTLRTALQSSPQQTADAMRGGTEKIIAPVENAAIAFGTAELNGTGQVGAVLSGYSHPVAPVNTNPSPTVVATVETSINGSVQKPVAQFVVGTSTTGTYTITFSVAGQASSTFTITASSTPTATSASSSQENPAPPPHD